jgi:hypothetical protein
MLFVPNQKLLQSRETEDRKRRGRPDSWVLGLCQERKATKKGKEVTFLVCQHVSILVGGSAYIFACATTSMLDHMMRDHGYSEDGVPPEVKQKKLAVNTNGSLGFTEPVMLTAQDVRTQAFWVDLARWFALDGEAPNTVRHSGFQQFFAKRMPGYPIPEPMTITARLKSFSDGLCCGFAVFKRV